MGRRIIKLPILIALLLLLSTALYLLVFAISGRETASPNSSPVSDDTADINALSQTPNNSEDYAFTLITALQMDSAGISRGSLILVNSDHPFEIPTDHDFVPIANAKSSSYMVVRNDMLLSASIMGSLNDMMDTFYAETGISNVTIRSAFRSIEEQQQALDNRIAIQGYAEALRYAMRPGHSEHHTGLAFDFGIQNEDSLGMFHGTGDFAWFRNNSYRFGFILRYTEELYEITGISNEPWHYRYVGVPHAYFIHRNGWALEEYIEYIMTFTPEDPVRDYVDGVSYEIFYTQETEIVIPAGAEYSISGNNIDGFIVTLRR